MKFAFMRASYLFPLLILCSGFSHQLFSQQEVSLSGSLESNTNFYVRDTTIGAANIPQYEHQQIGTDTWLSLRAQAFGFDMGLRYDLFLNSALLNPTSSYTDQGIGKWHIGRQIGKLYVLGGYIYDQIGSGMIFRSYEERALLIDNALVGAKVTYDLMEDWTIKGFIGQQRDLFEVYPSVLAGGSIEGFELIGKEGLISVAPGFGVLHKTLSDEQVETLAGTLAQYTPEDFIEEVPYNTMSFSLYNTLSAGPFSWYIEGAYKTEEVFWDTYATRTLWTGEQILGKFVLDKGYVFYTTLSYAGGGLGVSAQYKRTHNFSFKADPYSTGYRGAISFLPPMSRVNTYRLTARYSPATQDLDEEALQLDVRYAVSKNFSLLVNLAKIIRPDAEQNREIYSEIYTQFTLKKPREWTLIGGVQFQNYDQELYEGKPGVPIVETITPYIDYLYKIDQKKSIRTEVQYMNTEQDHGSWLYGLAEFSISPHWIFELSDMWNIAPLDKPGVTEKKLHYPTAGVVYSTGPTRYAIRYVKQVEGIVCSGGICRLEPAFSGFKLNISSNF